MKDGSVFPASDYWVADNRLHFRVSYGGETTIDVDQLDWQRTVDENAKRNIRFALKPQPDTAVLDRATTASKADSNAFGDNALIRDASVQQLNSATYPGFITDSRSTNVQ
jgi:hypothetical protein